MSASRAAEYGLVRGSILYVWLTAVRWVLRCTNKSSTTAWEVLLAADPRLPRHAKLASASYVPETIVLIEGYR